MIASVVRVVLKALGIETTKPTKKRKSVTNALEKLDSMQAQMGELEAVTMTWSLDTLTPEERRQMGLEE